MTAPVTELVRLRGPDALSYSDTQCTQDLSGLDVGATAATLVLDPKGEIVAAALLRRVGPELVSFEVPVGVGTALRARLERFAIRSKLEVEGPQPLGAADTPALHDELARIGAGLPGPAELARGLVVHGLSEELRERCVSFTKGCYPGQELVARMQARGATPPYVLVSLVLDEPAHADDPAGDPAREGRITSVAKDPGGSYLALAVVHRRDAAETTIEVRSSASTLLARVQQSPSLRSQGGDAP